MNDAKKKRIKTIIKYTWPFYFIGGILVAFGINFLFGITHRLPEYKQLTIFVSGEVHDSKKLETDMLKKYKEKEIKAFTCYSGDPSDTNYYTKLSVLGYNSSDVLIIPVSKIDSDVSAFAINIDENLINNYYQGYTLFEQNGNNYGVKLNKEKVKDYMYLPSEDCYLFLNGRSETLGEYSKDQIKERDASLLVVKEWGM